MHWVFAFLGEAKMDGTWAPKNQVDLSISVVGDNWLGFDGLTCSMVWWFDGLNFSCCAFLFKYSLFSSICTHRKEHSYKNQSSFHLFRKWSYKDLQTYQAISVPMFLLKGNCGCVEIGEYIDSIPFFRTTNPRVEVVVSITLPGEMESNWRLRIFLFKWGGV